MSRFLVTGGAGFFGSILARRLRDDGHACVTLDREEGADVVGDVRDEKLLDGLFAETSFDAVFHCAAMLAHDIRDKQLLWTSNVDGTRILAACAARHGMRKLVYISSNCVYSRHYDAPVAETEPPAPVEVYGRSKLEGERVLREQEGLVSVILRVPTILDEGRLGLLAILFEFIDEGRKVWLVGKGANRYQFVYAPDLADACVRALNCTESRLFHVGSDDVSTLREVYEHVIEEAATGARVASLPRALTLGAMRCAHAFGLSPLGPYHYRMIASSFVFDNRRIKAELGWQPTLTNEQMLLRAYDYYRKNRAEIEQRTDGPAHKRSAKMGIIRLLKWLS